MNLVITNPLIDMLQKIQCALLDYKNLEEESAPLDLSASKLNLSKSNSSLEQEKVTNKRQISISDDSFLRYIEKIKKAI